MSDRRALTPLSTIIAYGSGEGAVSIAVNGFSNFALLYYTSVLGLSPKYAGIALSVSALWDAVFDPVMGHVTDNTRSRYGRRHPYILIGGVLLSLSFYFIWRIPGFINGDVMLFAYILLVSLMVKTFSSMFMIAYTALGFELCTNYEERSKVQGIRFFINMLVNLFTGALAWKLFFADGSNVDGSHLDGSKIPENYLSMGFYLSLSILIFIIVCTYSTRRYAVDSRSLKIKSNRISAVYADIAAILKDRLAMLAIGYFCVALLGMLFVSQIQMFTYIEYMGFTSNQKTYVHGAGMVAFAIASLSLSTLVRKVDKKGAGKIGIAIAVTGGVMLYVCFVGGLVERGTTSACVIFALLQSLWWGGSGFLAPLSASMIADVSEINYRRTGELKDGSYAAILSFLQQATLAVGLFCTGYILDWAGYVSGENVVQSSDALSKIASITFLSGPVMVLLALPVLLKYPVNREYMSALQHQDSKLP